VSEYEAGELSPQLRRRLQVLDSLGAHEAAMAVTARQVSHAALTTADTERYLLNRLVNRKLAARAEISDGTWTWYLTTDGLAIAREGKA
jgi:hypothetical protein